MKKPLFTSNFSCRVSLFLLFQFFLIDAFAQDGVLIDYVGTTRDPSAVLDVRSSTQGAMVPRLTFAQRNLVVAPATSLLIYQTDNTPGYYYNSGTPASPVWTRLFEGTGNNNVIGSGTTNRVVKFTGANTVGNSNITDDANTIVFSPPTYSYFNTGSVYVQNTLIARGDITDDGGNVTINDALDITGAIPMISGFSPANNAIRLTPNFHINAPVGNAIILNWDNGAVGGGTQQLRVGNGAGVDQFYVRADGQFYGRYFADLDNAGYYVDPNGTSEMNVFTRGTLARSSLNALQNNSPVTTRSVQADGHRNGVMGWGNTNLNTINSNWGSGFFDSWGSPANGPGASSHYVGLQGSHYNHQDGTNSYGFQMVYAGGSNNRFFWRSGWPGPQSWVEMMHSGNISGNAIQNQWGGNQSANFHISGSGRAGADLRAPIFYDENNTGYYADPNGVSNLAGITTSVNYNTFHTWTNLPNHAGFYSSNHNGAHFYPNDGSYGSWRILGTRNGWAGLEFPSGAGNISLMIGQGGWGGMTTGMHANSYGWLWRFEHDDLYADRLIDVNNGGYYVDPTGTTVLAYDNYLSHIGGVVRIGHASNLADWCCGGYDWWGCQGWCEGFKLSVNGSAEAHGWYGWSDGRFKENIQQVTGAVDLIKSMRGVFYDWAWDENAAYEDKILMGNKSEYRKGDKEASPGSKPGARIGVIAQEVQEILPQVVRRVEDTDTSGTSIGYHLSVNYDDLVPVLIEAIKEQQEQIDELRAMIAGNGNIQPSTTPAFRTEIEACLEAMQTYSGDGQDLMIDFLNRIKEYSTLNPSDRSKLSMIKGRLNIH